MTLKTISKIWAKAFKRLDNIVQNHRLQPIVALVLGLVISLFSIALVSRMSNPPIALAILFSFIASNYLATFIVDQEWARRNHCLIGLP